MQNVISPVNTEERAKLGIRPGDTVRIHQKIVEKGKTRLQVFEGLVLGTKHGIEPGATFTVRATLSGIGVEKIFPLYAPFIEKMEIVKRSKVRRAKLYFIREKVAREVKRQLRNMRLMNVSTGGAPEVVAAETAPEAPEESVETEAAPEEASPESVEEKTAEKAEEKVAA
jgi:large subunit ribosomal protein L19